MINFGFVNILCSSILIFYFNVDLFFFTVCKPVFDRNWHVRMPGPPVSRNVSDIGHIQTFTGSDIPKMSDFWLKIGRSFWKECFPNYISLQCKLVYS